MSIGTYVPIKADGDFYDGSISFNSLYETWVVDASVDPDTIHDALTLVGITFIGFIILPLAINR